MKKILFIVPTLSLGGAERVAHTLAVSLSQLEYEITVLTRNRVKDFYILPEKIDRISFEPLKPSKTPFGSYIRNKLLIKKYRKVILQNKPDLIISFMHRTNIRTLMACKGIDVPVIITEHNNPSSNPLGNLWEKLRVKWYVEASALVSISQGTNDFFNWVPDKKRYIINNPLFPPEKEDYSKLITDRRFILSAGRLNRVKNYPFLIDVFSIVAPKFPELDLIILGEGEERKKLEDRISSLELNDRIHLPGMISPITPYMSKADVFCLTSNTEGFGNVIIEAMAQKTAVISTDCPTGPAEIITNMVDGILIPLGERDLYSEKLSELLLDTSLRMKIESNGEQRSKDFSLEKILEEWVNLIDELTS